MKKIAGIFVIILMSYSLFGSSNSPEANRDYCKSIYSFYISGKIDAWGEVIQKMHDEYQRSKDPQLLKQFIFSNYGYIGYQIGMENEETAARHLDEVEKYLENLMEDENPPNAWVYSMYSAMQGFRLSFSPWRAPFVGPSVVRNIDMAIQVDSLEPMGWIEKGNSYLYRPSFFGGSAEKALSYYKQALSLFEKSKERARQNWIYLNLHVQIAECYLKMDNPQMAMKVYNRVLEVEPDFSWVKDELKPQLSLMMDGVSQNVIESSVIPKN